jgi:hypothetical protein
VRTQQKTMSSLSRHNDNDCNAGEVVPGAQTTDPTLTIVDMADPTVQATVLKHPNPLMRSKQICLWWISTAPMTKTLGKGIITAVNSASVGDQRQLDGHHACPSIDFLLAF